MQLVFPQTLKEKILTSLHDDMGHQGFERTLHLIRDRCYWPSMNSDVEAWIKRCERCTLSKEPLPRVRPAMNNEIVDSGNLKGDRIRYIEVTAICRLTS